MTKHINANVLHIQKIPEDAFTKELRKLRAGIKREAKNL